MADAVVDDQYLDLEEIGVDINEDLNPLTRSFNRAANHLKKLLTQVNNEVLLTLYGYYKQGSEGPCNTPKPSWYDMKSKSKWEAWNKLGDMSKSKAQTLYIETIKKIDPNFDEESQDEGQGVKVSLMADDAVPYNEMNIVDHVKNGNIKDVQQYISKNESTIKANINKLDDLGLGLIHWATDSGHVKLIEILLTIGADVNLVDSEGQTALHYASSCGHADCIKFLLENGADPDVKDKDDCKPVDVALENEIKMLLS